ncbi:MAG: restriction endonuclease subunit S [Candidatus Aminicenantales bacterium]
MKSKQKIPIGWTHIKLGEYLTELSERNRRSDNNDMPVLSVTNKPGFVVSEEFFDRKVFSRDLSNYKVICEGQFAYNPSRVNVGSIARLKEFEKGLLSPMYVVFEAKEALDSSYLDYWISSQRFSNLVKAGTQGSVRDSLNFSSLSEFSFNLPPEIEQKKIVSILTCVDSVIDKTQDIINLTQTVKKGLMQELFTRGFPGIHNRFRPSPLGVIPADWKIVRVSDIATVDYGISESVSLNTNPQIGWPILTGANINLEGKISLHKLVYIEPPKEDRFVLKKGDVLLNWRSGSPCHVGKSALFDLNGQYTYASFILRIRPLNANSRYLHLLFNFMRERNMFTTNVSQQVNFKMNASVFRELEIPLPSIKEQGKIVDVINKVEQRLSAEIDVLGLFKRERSALMQVLLSGEVRVKI